MNDRELICPCFDLSSDEVQSLINEHRIKKYSQVEELTYAGSACGFCIPRIAKLIDKIVDRRHEDPN